MLQHIGYCICCYDIYMYYLYQQVIEIKCRGKMRSCLSRVNNYDQSASPGFAACGGGAVFDLRYMNIVDLRWSKFSFWGDFLNLLSSFAR